MSGTPLHQKSTIPWKCWPLALFFIAAGINHFLKPAPYLTMMPAWLPAPLVLVQLSGAAEILGGAGVLCAPLRRAAGWGLMLLLLAVFPANVQVALHGWPGVDLPAWVLWARLPLQGLLLWWVYRICLSAVTPEAATTGDGS